MAPAMSRVYAADGGEKSMLSSCECHQAAPSHVVLGGPCFVLATSVMSDVPQSAPYITVLVTWLLTPRLFCFVAWRSWQKHCIFNHGIYGFNDVTSSRSNRTKPIIIIIIVNIIIIIIIIIMSFIAQNKKKTITTLQISANGTSQKPMDYATAAGPNSREWKACT